MVASIEPEINNIFITEKAHHGFISVAVWAFFFPCAFAFRSGRQKNPEFSQPNKLQFNNNNNNNNDNDSNSYNNKNNEIKAFV